MHEIKNMPVVVNTMIKINVVELPLVLLVLVIELPLVLLVLVIELYIFD